MTTTIQVTVGGGETNSVAIHQDDVNGNPVGGDIIVTPGNNATITITGNQVYSFYEVVPNTVDTPPIVIPQA